MECEMADLVCDGEPLSVAGDAGLRDAQHRYSIRSHGYSQVSTHLGLEGEYDATETLGGSHGVAHYGPMVEAR